jgi:hypothetical protein
MSFGNTLLHNSMLDYTEDIFVAKLSSLTGIPEINKNDDILVYPNPANSYFTVETTQQATIEIFNMQGQLIKTLATTGNKTNLDVSALPSGVYVVEVKSEKVYKVGKFVKE